MMARRYYLAPWVWDTTIPLMPRWRPPAGTVGLVDLRSLANAALAGPNPAGLGFFATDGTAVAGGMDFGTDLNTALTPAQVNNWKSAIGLSPIVGGSVLDVLWQTLTVASDPTGAAGPLPIIPTPSLDMELLLGGHSVVRSERWSRSHAAWPKIKAVLQRDYAGIRTAAKAGKHKPNFYRSFLGGLVRKYSGDYHDFLGGQPDEGPIPPGTQLHEDFTHADSTSAYGDKFAWSSVQGTWGTSSNRAYDPAADWVVCVARCDTDLGASDYYVQTTFTSSDWSQTYWAGPLGRKDATGTLTFYSIGHYYGDRDFHVLKTIAGTQTTIADGAYQGSSFGDSQFTVKLVMSGSSLSGTISDGHSWSPFTDTAISGGTRGGITAVPRGGNCNYFSDWVADDGISAPSGNLLPQHPQDGITPGFSNPMSGGMR